MYDEIAKQDPDLQERLDFLQGTFPEIPMERILLILLWVAITGSDAMTELRHVRDSIPA